MGGFSNPSIPFRTRGNRQYIAADQVMAMPWLGEFIKQFPHCFEVCWLNDVVWFDPEGKVPLEDQPKFDA